MNKKIFFGIDPGKGGALAYFCMDVVSARIIDYGVCDLPLCKVSRASDREEVDPVVLKAIMMKICNDMAMAHEQSVMTLEHVWARPSGGGGHAAAGLVSNANLVNAMTCVKTVTKLMGLPFLLVIPQTWKKHYALSSDKEAARAMAISLFPKVKDLLKFKKNADRAEALLIAWYGFQRFKMDGPEAFQKD